MITIRPVGREIHPLRIMCPYSELFWSVALCIQSECGKIRTRITPNTDNFQAVIMKFKVREIIKIENPTNQLEQTAAAPQPAITCSKLKLETLEQGVKYV